MCAGTKRKRKKRQKKEVKDMGREEIGMNGKLREGKGKES